MKKTILSVILILAIPALASLQAEAQDARQRTVETIVQDALAQLPAQTAADLDREMADIAASAPESVEILAGMLLPPGQGQNSKVEYALNGVVNHVAASGNGAEDVRAGLVAGIRECTDVTNASFLLTLLGRIATGAEIPVFVEYAGDENLASVAVGILSGLPGSGDGIMELVRTDGASRPLLAYAVARKGLAEAEPYLQQWIGELGGDAGKDSDPSSKVDTPDMRSYLHALSLCGSSASLKLLKKESPYDYVTLLDRIARKGDYKTALRGAEKLLKSDDTGIRCAALGVIVSVKGALAEKEVVAALKDSDREYRCAALDYAAAFRMDGYLVKGIKSLFPSLPDDARTDVVNWAGNVRVEWLLDEVLSCLSPDSAVSPELAMAAVSAAGKIGGDRAADALVSLLSGDRELAEAAYEVLLSFDGDLGSRLERVIGDGGESALMALSLACERRMSALAPDVFALLESGRGDLREQAYSSLWGFVTPDDCGKLGGMLEKSSDDFEISALQKALCHALKGLSPEEQYAKAADLMSCSGNPALYYPALAQAGTKEAVESLRKGYEAGSEDAFRALMTVDSYPAADVLLAIAQEDAGKADAALARFVALVKASGQDGMAKVSRYAAALNLNPGDEIRNEALKALAEVPVMPAFLLASGYLDDKATAYQAANAVRSIAAKTADEIDYKAEKAALEKAMDIYAAAGGADDGYAVDEIKKMLAGLQPPAEKFVLPEDEARAGYEVLFDGTDLSKWTGDTTGYTPVNGTIYVTAGYGDTRNLYTKKEYRDFILRFEFCFDRPGVNNGVGIRTPMGKDAAYWGMCECQILDHDDPIYKNLKEYQVHGSAYGIVPAKRIVHKPSGTWNFEEIKVVGDRITVTLNGEVILDANLREACQGHNVSPDGGKYNPYTADHKNHPGMFNEKGHVGFLGHGAGIKFRNVRILDLSE